MREKNSSLAPAVEQVVLKALAKDTAQRFANVRTFATALEQASESQAGQARGPLSATPPPLAPTSATASISVPLKATPSAPSMPSLAVPLPKDAQFNLDTPPTPKLFQHILWEIGRKVRDGE